MRHQTNARQINVKKADLINKIKENKAQHILEYNEAVEAYKAEAQRQLNEQKQALENGKLNLRLNLITPVNNEAEYDRLLTMFEWEIEDEVVLSQGEFNEYVLDELASAIHAKALNSTYSGGGRG